LWSCKQLADPSSYPWLTVWRSCKPPDDNKGTPTPAAAAQAPAAPAAAAEGTPPPATAVTSSTTVDAPKKSTVLQNTNVWFGIPMNPGVLFYLVLGGLLIGLGAPFWFNVVTTITNIRSGPSGAGGATGSPPHAPRLMDFRASPEADMAQPATPSGAFLVAQAAKK
jgi:hypothetical protein